MQTNFIIKAPAPRKACSECHTQETKHLHYHTQAGVILCNACTQYKTQRKASKARNGTARHAFITLL